MICGGIAVIAEVDPTALNKRHQQGWVQEVPFQSLNLSRFLLPSSCLLRSRVLCLEFKPKLSDVVSSALSRTGAEAVLL